MSAAPGTSVSGTLDVAALGGDTGTNIPFTIIHGATSGPVLALIAGNARHGVRADHRASADAHGRSIQRHYAAPSSSSTWRTCRRSSARTIYYSPADGKNLNRVFPGRANGTLSERIADTITREVITRATHVIDLHCGDGNESLSPYSYWITTGPAGVADESRALALAFGLDHIVVDRRAADGPGGLGVSVEHGHHQRQACVDDGNRRDGAWWTMPPLPWSSAALQECCAT